MVGWLCLDWLAGWLAGLVGWVVLDYNCGGKSPPPPPNNKLRLEEMNE